MYVGQTRAAGFAKEPSPGTLTVPPTEYLPYIPPETFHPAITLLTSTAVRNRPDRIAKAARGPGELKGMKMRWEAEPENIGNALNAVFGQDAVTEHAQVVIDNTNNKIDFTENGGGELTATIANGTYAIGASSAVVGSLCAAVKTALDAAGDTYTVAYNSGTRKFTITKNSGVFVLLFSTGTNVATCARTVLGFTAADSASAIAATSDGTAAAQVWDHLFTRVDDTDQLPTYSAWIDAGPKFKQVAGCMLNKLDLDVKAKEFVTVDTDWTGLDFDDDGVDYSPSYSNIGPFVFNQALVKVDGVSVYDYQNVKVSFDNFVKADHVLGGSIYPGKIYSEGFEVTIDADLIVEDLDQYDKFLAGNSASFQLTLTHGSDVTNAVAGTKYALDLVFPEVYYAAAPFPNPQGVLMIKFTAKAIFNVGASKTCSATLRNSVAAAYSA